MSSSWKQLVTELEKISAGAPKAAWRTAKIVHSLLNSGEFLAEACSGKHDERDAMLDKYCQRLGRWSPLELAQMIDHFPLWEDWKDGKLRDLFDKTCRAINRKKVLPISSEPRKANRRQTNAAAPSVAGNVADAPPPPEPELEKPPHIVIAELRSQLAEKDSIIAEKDLEITKLKRSLAGMELKFAQLRKAV